MRLDRRQFLSLSASAAAATALPQAAHATPATKPGNLKFVFFTDTHTEPELSGDEGTAMALRKIKSIKPDFCIQGGDHCFDLGNTTRERSMMLLDLYQKTEQALDGVPVHHALGNHDVLGRGAKSNVPESDPLYAKKAFEQRFDTKPFYSFDRKGYHFVILDSVFLLPDGEYEGRIDTPQLEWLKSDLAAQPAGTPTIVTTHIPLVSAVLQYNASTVRSKRNEMMIANSYDVLPLFEGHNVIAVLQGHTHINETVYWRNTPFITSGAVCGNWWKGSRWGTPEGYTVLELANGHVNWRYDTYGWQSKKPQADPSSPIAQPIHSPGFRQNGDFTF